MTKTRSNRKNSLAIRKLTGVSLLLALCVALTMVANYAVINGFSLNLALVPVVVGAIVYGPLAGLFLGTCVGALTIAAPATINMIGLIDSATTASPHHGLIVFETVLVCLIKMAMAGLIPGLIFKAFRKKHFNVGVILASLSAPVINTGLFALFMSTMLRSDVNAAFVANSGKTFAAVLFGVLIGVNFFIEFAINAALSPAVLYLSKYAFRNVNIGSGAIGKQEDLKPATKTNSAE